MEIKKAIVTGGTGAIGVALINELINCGASVTVICNPNSSRINNIPKKANIVRCDISKLSSLQNELKNDYDAFFHLAWNGTYGDARLDEDMQMKNVEYTLDAVKLAKKCGCSVFFGAGSQSEYGHIDGVLKCNTPCAPDNFYGKAKLVANKKSNELCRELSIRHIWCRIISVYGPFDGEYTMVMSTIKKLLAGKTPSLTKGEQIWDYIYSKDAAKAIVALAKSGKDGKCYPLGSGNSKSLKEYIEEIRDTVNPSASLGFGKIPYYKNQVMHLEADISDLIKDTGYKPTTDFSVGINETAKWLKEVINK